MWATADDLTEADKAVFFLESGFPLQKAWVMQNLHLVLQNDSRLLLKNILVNFI